MGRLKRCMLPTDNKNLSFSDAISENTNVVFFFIFFILSRIEDECNP